MSCTPPSGTPACTVVNGVDMNFPYGASSDLGPMSTGFLNHQGLLPAQGSPMQINSGGMAHIVDYMGTALPQNKGQKANATVAQVGSGSPIFATIYQGTPADIPSNPSNLWKGQNTEQYTMHVDSVQVPVPGPSNSGKFANWQVNQFQNPNNTVCYPPYRADGWNGIGDSSSTGYSDLLKLISTDHTSYDDYYQDMKSFFSYTGDGGNRAQDYQFMIGQGVRLGSGVNTMIKQIGGGDTPRKGGLYNIATVAHPLDNNGIYDPTTSGVQDLVNACSRVPFITSLSPSYGFAGYCMEDLIFPDAWDKTQTKTITCPTTITTDSAGKPVKAPGIICVQGNGTDATQFSEQSASSGGGCNFTPFWNTADMAPACFDLAVNGTPPTEPITGKVVASDTGIALGPWYQQDYAVNKGGQYDPGNIADWNYCIPEPIPPGWNLCPTDGNFGDGGGCQPTQSTYKEQLGFNVIQRCFNTPPSNINYGNLYFKNVCKSQLPMDRWSFYASLNNNIEASKGLITNNFDAPGSGYIAAPTDILERWWLAQPLNNMVDASGDTIPNNFVDAPNLGAGIADQEGGLIPSDGNPISVNFFMGYGSSNPSLVSSNVQAPAGVHQAQDMSHFYATRGLTTLQGNYGSVPGAADPFGINAGMPAYSQADFQWQ